MVAGLLFLALAFFAVGQAGASRNGTQSGADAAALAAAPGVP
ncbi:pilus assembly protein TadG-related protein [Streptomyces jumonjinensis]|nr:pilus assembly protein TadG-related protein [Streptomyces jumonjinensis]